MNAGGVSNEEETLKKRAVLAERVYCVNGDKDHKIVVRIGQPKKVREQNRYKCPMEIVGFGTTIRRAMNGCDIFEAIQLALIMIGTDLKHMSGQLEDDLIWGPESRNDIGFPVYPDYSLNPIMEPSGRS